RSCGVLMHITSLPSPYGIGTLGEEAEKFADWLQKAGQSWWQVLPVGPTRYGDSPYQPFSSFAGNPLLIDLDELCRQDLLSKDECASVDYGADPEYTDYDRITKTRDVLLRKAFAKFTDDVGYTSFCLEEAEWLDDYALFTAIKKRFGGKSWTQWDDDIRFRSAGAMARYADELKDEIRYVKWCQYVFSRQWTRFHGACGSKGIKLIGDIPIYVSPDCADVWAQPELFELEESRNPKRVAGVPPDYFSATGQLWGNPLYDWQEMKARGFDWWIERVRKSTKNYDVLRIDHFRAFDTYYAIPFGQKTAEHGKWEQGPGMELFDAIKAELGKVNIIAEDLGEIFDSVKVLLRKTGFPGMRVLQFGFNPENADNDHLPHSYPKNCVAYTGTHDNATIMQWYGEADRKSRAMAKRYLKKGIFEGRNYSFIRSVYASPANLAVIPMQDVMGLGKEGRMNVPSTLGGNWNWRMKKMPKRSDAAKLRELAETYFRLNSDLK
ncbi:MAG: 4-alpha-glucanotransferase, partial [Oscillospiraceae bacterium]|nr:4-alpha-glucanotransferase [Oscillospiraceae bacterium]